MTDAERDDMAVALADIVLRAGPAVMEEYARRGDARAKADGSPVTAADERAEEIITSALRALRPDLAVVAEEAASRAQPAPPGELFFLVDPLDGTKEFLSGNGEFTVNIALVQAGEPIAGAVLAPALGRLWFAGAAAHAATVGDSLPSRASWEPLRVRRAPERLTALASRSHADARTQEFLAKLPVGDRISAGSSLKFCVIAEGRADLYPRFGPTMEWDTAAGDAVLTAAGGVVASEDGMRLRYGKIQDLFRNSSFLAYGDAKLTNKLVNAL